MFLARSRFHFLLAFLAGCLVTAATLYLEYSIGLEPCGLCQVQRFFLLGLCAANLAVALRFTGSLGRRACTVLCIVFALGGAVSAACQIWLQRLAPELLMLCQAEQGCLWQDLSPFQMLLTLYRSEACAHIRWMLFDLSLPELSLLLFIGLGLPAAFQIAQSFRSKPRPEM